MKCGNFNCIVVVVVVVVVSVQLILSMNVVSWSKLCWGNPHAGLCFLYISLKVQ
jgi:hypothetical protein